MPKAHCFQTGSAAEVHFPITKIQSRRRSATQRTQEHRATLPPAEEVPPTMPLNRLFDSGQPVNPPPDVQRTSLGIDVLSRFACNTWDEATAGSTRQFDAVVIGAGMFGGYCADKIFRFGEANGLKVLVLDAGPFLVGTHVQNLPNAGINVPGPITPSNDPGVPRELVWGIPWRGNVDFIGQAY